MKNNLFSFMQGALFGTVFLIGVFYFATHTVQRDTAISEVGACVSEQASIDGHTGTSQEVWNTYAEFCKEFVEKSKELSKEAK